jgi:hypothetical protein
MFDLSISNADRSRPEDSKGHQPQHWDDHQPKGIMKVSPCKERKSVKFSHTEVRVFPQILGDSPCCSNGLPLSLGWSHVSQYITQLNDSFGLDREQRKSGVFRLDAFRRKEILQQRSVTQSNTNSKESIIAMLGGDSCSKTYMNQRKGLTNTISTKQYSDPELKRAERRMFRERERMNANRKAVRCFFDNHATVRG